MFNSSSIPNHTWINHLYVAPFYTFLNLSNDQNFQCQPDVEKSAFMHIGDHISEVDKIPVFSKVRVIGNDYPILLQVFALNRHWLPPTDLHQNKFHDPAWNEKLNKVIFRVASTGNKRNDRLSFVEEIRSVSYLYRF